MTLEEAYTKGKRILKEHEIDDAPQDALWMLLEVCGIDRAYYLAHGNDEVDITCQDGRENRYFAMIGRRAEHIPLQHILGYTEFMGLRFEVNEDVLIPRQDTETLVEEALQHVHDGMRILDICTGSGCILLSLLNYSNDCTGIGSDISDKALETASQNAAGILSSREDVSVEFIRSDIFDNIEGRFDIIVSNPPYIRSDVIKTLAPEVKDHDPMIALDGGSDGLMFYRRIVAGLDEHLVPGGCVFFETGYDQGDAVCALLKDKGYLDVRVIKDYSGNDRVVTGVRSCLIN
ncbi:MAG: peptide chain release factor N(5)-glutamine methyltransferase [Lachnospiraceae bacterium]|nr:peptide chain release factor N(5)-glutamine methyltransferase [Lachnospiraceae bacterium]